MNSMKKKNLIILIAIIFIVLGFSISNYLDKQKVYILSAENEKNTEIEIIEESNYEINNLHENINSIEKIVVHIEGEVVSPGVYELNKDNRVFDAIEAAGGLLEDANKKKINLAKRINDEEYIYIPNTNEDDIYPQDIDSQSYITINNNENTNTNNTLININTANTGQLQELQGVGQVLASRIVEYRNQNGKFSSKEELKNVSGIGDKKFDEIKDKIVL